MIVAALASGEALGERGPLRKIDTHMSNLFLGQDRVYKLKRAVRHPFCDMSSPQARERACREELSVNSSLAPALYERVLPISLTPDGHVQIDGPGEPVDWIVVMRRFPDGALLAEMADRGQLGTEQIDEAVDAVAAFHLKQPPHYECGRPADLKRTVEGLRRTEAESARALGLRSASGPLFDRLDFAIAANAKLVEARRRGGYVRRGHGDLHLGNICVFEGRVLPFDALEFDPGMATADAIYDIAFLLMDLRAHGERRLANRAMNRYWNARGEAEEALALLPMYMALRAAVRVAVLVEAGELAAADRYRRLGVDLLEPCRPRLVAIGGLSGTGKSTLAQSLAPHLCGSCGARVLRTDMLRKQDAGIPGRTRMPEGAYAPKARAATYRLLCERVHAALGAGASVVADATFQEMSAREAIACVRPDLPFAGLWLSADSALRIGRIANRSGDESDVTAAVAAAQTEPSGLGEGWRRLPADGPAAEVTRRARCALAPALPGAEETVCEE